MAFSRLDPTNGFGFSCRFSFKPLPKKVPRKQSPPPHPPHFGNQRNASHHVSIPFCQLPLAVRTKGCSGPVTRGQWSSRRVVAELRRDSQRQQVSSSHGVQRGDRNTLALLGPNPRPWQRDKKRGRQRKRERERERERERKRKRKRK